MCSTDVKVCQVVIEDVNADYGVPSAILGSGEHALNYLRNTKSSPATYMREIFCQNNEGIAPYHRPHHWTPQAETTTGAEPRMLDTKPPGDGTMLVKKRHWRD